jgi:transposase
MEVHSAATVYCVLDAEGSVVERGSIATTATDLGELARRLSAGEELLAAQEVGTQCYFVHDAISAVGVRILSFHAAQLRMIAASRKKTDKRDAYWIAKTLQTGMTPHPVHVPSAEVRRLRGLLHQRQALVAERKRWLLRARSYLRSAGMPLRKGASRITRLLDDALKGSDGLPTSVADGLELCARLQEQLGEELAVVEEVLLAEAKGIAAIQRLKTIPAVGDWVAITLYAAVGDIDRFGSARLLAAYAGLVPSVHQSGATLRNGPITKAGRDRFAPRSCRRGTCFSGSATPRTPSHCARWRLASTPHAHGARSPSSQPLATFFESPSTCCVTGPPTTRSASTSRSARRAQRRRLPPSQMPLEDARRPKL